MSVEVVVCPDSVYVDVHIHRRAGYSHCAKNSCITRSHHVILESLNFSGTMYSSTITQFEEPPKKKPTEEASEPTPLPCREEGEQPLIWRNIIALAILHGVAIYNVVFYAHLATLGTWIFSK